MSEMILSESTLALLQDPGLGTQDVDGKVRYLLEAEYMRRLSRYRRTNSLLSEKYGMTFEEFTVQRVVKQRGYTWEVEKDAMNWMSSGSHSRSRISNPRPTTLLCACTLRQDSSFRPSLANSRDHCILP